VTSAEFDERLRLQAEKAGVANLHDALVSALETYYRLLARWNEKINLTSLDLADPAPETIDRLLVEPLAAARYVPATARLAVDLGSGGGSPAIPFALAAPQLRCTLVESRSRKAVFLREAIRTLTLPASVEQCRFEELTERQEFRARFDLVTVRAVRVDHTLRATARALLAAGGELFIFGSSGESVNVQANGRTHLLTAAATLVIEKG
jgi:16S rRNA (guanine527-N7)-methyltransferase